MTPQERSTWYDRFIGIIVFCLILFSGLSIFLYDPFNIGVLFLSAGILTIIISLLYYRLRQKHYGHLARVLAVAVLSAIIVILAVTVTADSLIHAGGVNPKSPVSPFPVGADTTVPWTTPEIVPRYRQGDIIDFSPNIDKVPHLIILDCDKKTGQYQYDIIFRNENGSWGYRIYPEPRWQSVDFVEKNATYLITHINITDIETWFPSKEIFEKTR